MYFVNEEHERNFNFLLGKYPIATVDKEYQTGFYIVSNPVIYHYCNGNPVIDGNGPFDWFFDENCDKSGLSNGYRQLVQAGIHLYNNFDEFSLYLSLGTWGFELFEVFIQACKIRRGEI
ncbi:DUF2538 family protein [Paenibacillus oryzisoli]|uniref:DUF2538 family protein n=1 Tax=Paenibacillus oryzisoli TaxID=1850517 RepID=UPI003D2BCEC6